MELLFIYRSTIDALQRDQKAEKQLRMDMVGCIVMVDEVMLVLYLVSMLRGYSKLYISAKIYIQRLNLEI